MVVERELTHHQVGLVDTCFEEGDYDAAISALDKLRHPASKPYDEHIRNLVYIALFPSHRVDEPPDLGVENTSASPSKMGRITSKSHRASHDPTRAHSAAAQRVLLAFAQTNAPASLCCALPSFKSSAIGTTNGFINGEKSSDSEISRRARCIVDARCFWEVLKDGFIITESSFVQDVSVPVTSQRGSTPQKEYELDDDPFARGPRLVGTSARPVLDWFLHVLDKDEQLTLGCGDARYSPLLLEQIPPTRAPSGGRSYLDPPLDVAFFCLRNPQMSGLGARLLTLLINLAHTIHIDLPMFLNSLSLRISVLSPAHIQTIFALIPDTLLGTQFQIALCRALLAGVNNGKTDPSRPKAAPRRVGTARTQSSSNIDLPPPSVIRTYPALSTAEILQLVSNTSSSSPGDLATRIRRLLYKFQLLCAYGHLQVSVQDAAWHSALQNGQLVSAINSGFDCPDDEPGDTKARAEDLKAILAVMGWYR